MRTFYGYFYFRECSTDVKFEGHLLPVVQGIRYCGNCFANRTEFRRLAIHDSEQRQTRGLRNNKYHISDYFRLQCSKALHTGHPPYLADLLHYHMTTKSTRSSASHLLSVPRHNLSSGSRAFRISAPKIWNSYLFTFCNLKLVILLDVI